MEVLATGGLSTVQDAGRFGHRQSGVGVAGAMDALAAAVGNAMLGNAADAAFIEVVLFPFRLRFDADGRIALTGADARATLADRAVWPWWCLPVRAGQVLALQSPAAGGAAYLCVAGGVDVPAVLGSRSTDLKAGFGGLHGRPLRKGDRLQALAQPGGADGAARQRKFGVVPPAVSLAAEVSTDDTHGPQTTQTTQPTPVRVLPATEWDAFSPSTQQTFLSTAWTVNLNSNRIGARLDGPALTPLRPLELLSHGIVPGVIQVPPSGQPIVMQCDAQTSGGYPKIATVIEADQWRVAQTPVGGRLRFSAVSLAEAHDAWAAQRRYLDKVRQAAEFAG